MSSGSLTQNAVRDALLGRDYQFVLHGRSTVRCPRPQRRNRQQNSRRRNQPYITQVPSFFDIEDFSRPERLQAVFRILQHEGGPGAGEDELTYDDFSPGEVYAALRQVSVAIRNRTYLPYPTRLVRIPKGHNRWRELQLQRIIDRVVAKALQIALDDFWRSHLPGIGRNVWHLFAEMQLVMRERRAFVLAIDDIENCFPSTPITTVMECHRPYITQSDLLWLIETVVRGHEGSAHTIGLDQGSPYSPSAMELALHQCLDTPLEAVLQGFPLLLRYVDNLTFACSNERQGLEALQAVGNILADFGMKLKCKDGPPWDTRDSSCKQSVLGLIPRWKDGQLTFWIPEDAFTGLQEGLSKALECRYPAHTAIAVANGWISSVGPALTGKVVPEVVERVVSTTRSYGLMELSSVRLSRVAQEARQRWLVLCEEYRRTRR